MTRKKVKLVWIASDNARKASYKKRRQGLMKKVGELSTLCGVYAFAVVHGPDDDAPTIWPSRPVALQLYRRYQSLPEVERQKKMMNQETYLKERTTKVQDQLKKHVKKNQDLEMDILMHELHNGRQLYDFSDAELLGLFWMVEEKMRESRKRIEYRQQVHGLPGPPVPPVPEPMDLLETSTGDGRSAFDQWFMDMVMNPEDMGEFGVGMGVQGEGQIPGFNGGIPAGDGGGANLAPSDWGYGGGDGSMGMSEIEKLMSSIGEVGDGSIGGLEFPGEDGFGMAGGEEMGLFPENGGEMTMNGFFEGGGSSNGGGDILGKGWSSSVFSSLP